MIYLLVVYLLTPIFAHAYLDPGTGAVLVNLLLAGIATLAFFLKGVFFRIIGKKQPAPKDSNTLAMISIFSEGKQYWSSFEPVVTALIRKGIPFNYFTLDVHDPALTIENELMISKFLGYGNVGLAKVSRIKSPILLSTTPNIGTPGYPVQKSPYVKRLVHVLHSLNDISWYKSGSLDHYDEVILGGDYQGKAITELEKLRNTKQKKLISLGLPYLDTLFEERKRFERERKPESKQDKHTVLVGTSWGSKSLLNHYGTSFIKQLAVFGFDVIVRPHPQSFRSEIDKMNQIHKELSLLSNIHWDVSISPTESLSRADVLISDTSALRFDFALVYEKPVITLDIPRESTKGYERDDLTEVWMDRAAKDIGIVLEESQVKDIERHVSDVLQKDYQKKIQEYREELLSNPGSSGNAIADYLSSLVALEGEA